MSVFDQPPSTAQVDPPGGFPPPVLLSLDDIGTTSSAVATPARRSRRPPHLAWFVGLSALALMAIAGNSVTVNGDDVTREPSITQATAPVTAAPATAIAPATTVSRTTLPATTVAPVTTVPVTTVPVTTVPVAAPAMEGVDVIDSTGSFVVQLPAGFHTNAQPVTISGVDMHHVSGAVDIDTYLAGDVSAFGATVLAGPTEQVASPVDFLVQFDPGQACTPTEVERNVLTSLGSTTVLSYEDCGGGDHSLVLLAADVDALQQLVFVGVQADGSADAVTRALAIAIFESFRQV